MISMDKKYVTRDGREVRIYAVDGFGAYRVHGAAMLNGGWHPESWDENGANGDGKFLDLIEVKPKITRTYWLIQQRGGNYAFYSDVDPRGRRMNSEIIAITGPHTVEFQEGDGL